MSLRDTLNNNKEAKEKADEFERRKPEFIKSRQDLSASICEKFKEILSEFEKDGLVGFEEIKVSVDEPNLGRYDVKGLKMNFGGKIVNVKMSGINIMGENIFEISREIGRSSVRTIFVKDDNIRILEKQSSNNLRGRPSRPSYLEFNKENLESAISDLVK